MSRRGNNPSRAERTQRRAAERVRRERKAMQIPDAIRALTETEEDDGG